MGQRKYPFQWVDVDKEETTERAKLFKRDWSIENPVVKSIPGNVYMNRKFASMAEAIYSMEIRPSDIWIITYPKCGTTWTQELVWQVVNTIKLDPGRRPFLERSPYLERSSRRPGPLCKREDLLPETLVQSASEDGIDPRLLANSVAWTEDMKSLRVIKTHLPLEFLPSDLLGKAKVIYVCRNPKDICVSYFHHTKTLQKLFQYEGNFEQYVNLFMKGKLGYGSYWSHLKGAWARRGHPDLMFIWYEDMKKDLTKIIKGVCRFTGYRLTDHKIRILEEILQIDNFRKMATEEVPTVEGKEIMCKFIRRGEVGDYKTLIKGELADKFDEWIQENTEGTDLPRFS